MTDRSLWQDLPRAARIVWLVLGVLSGVVILVPFLLPASLLFGIFPICPAKAAGSSCLFCGMTTAFVSIANGDLPQAQSENAGAIPLFVVLALNFAVTAAYTIVRVTRHANP